MSIEIKMDHDTYQRFVEIEKRLKELNKNYSIGEFEVYSHDTHYTKFHLLSDTEAITHLAQENGKYKEIIHQIYKDLNKFTIYHLRDGEIKNKVEEMKMNCIGPVLNIIRDINLAHRDRNGHL